MDCANEAEYQQGSDPFYTNSTHLPVNYTDDLFEALELQDPLQTKYTGVRSSTVFGRRRSVISMWSNNRKQGVQHIQTAPLHPDPHLLHLSGPRVYCRRTCQMRHL
ncbi:MAG: anaerobic ribonucleoside-triphosphate reductase [Desulfotignum sp.]|nr:anaerobic ribonucleoside-triphosphate reductase [Desulfotignum sp.]